MHGLIGERELRAARAHQREPARRHRRDRHVSHAFARSGTAPSGTIDRPAPAATRSPMSRIPSTSTGTRSVRCSARRGDLDLVTQRVADRREDERDARPGPTSGTGSGRSKSSAAGTSPTIASSRRCSTTSRVSFTGSVTTANASSRSATSSREAFRRTFGEPQRHAGRDACASPTTSGGTSHGLTVPTTPSVACPTCEALQHRQVRRSASSSLRIARARSSTRTPNSVGTAPRRSRTSSCTPSSASSWRTCSETFDCTVCSRSAAAVNEPSSATASSASS